MDGVTVATFAHHIDEALQQLKNIFGSLLEAFCKITLSAPLYPASFNASMLGLSCGGINPCGMPSEWTNFILASPCKAACLGDDV